MKKFIQFLSEAVNIVISKSCLNSRVRTWGWGILCCRRNVEEVYGMELMTKSGVPTKQDLGEQLQDEYPGAVVHQIYPAQTKNPNIKNCRDINQKD